MPVTVVWDNDEHTTICMAFDGHWTWDEVQEAVITSSQMIDTVDQVVDCIVDVSASIGVPSGALAHARNLVGQRHARGGLNVIVGASPIISAMWQAFGYAFQRLTRDEEVFAFAESVEEARARIAEKTRSTV